MKKFIVKSDWTATGLTKGDIVYEFTGCTYGCVSDDDRSSGVEHTSVTYKEDGSYPFKTIPKHLLEQV